MGENANDCINAEHSKRHAVNKSLISFFQHAIFTYKSPNYSCICSVAAAAVEAVALSFPIARMLAHPKRKYFEDFFSVARSVFVCVEKRIATTINLSFCRFPFMRLTIHRSRSFPSYHFGPRGMEKKKL